MATKEINRAIVREQFFTLNKLNLKAAAIKEDYRKKLSTLETQKNTYSGEYLEKQRAEAEQAMKNSLQGLHNEFTGQAEKLFTALTELNNSLDLTDPKLTTALNLINTIGSGLVGSDFETSTIDKINSQFAGDQSALKILRSAYQAKNIPFTQDLDAQIYNLTDAIHQITLRADAAFLQGQSINALAGIESKYAALEGFTDFEKLPDPTGFDEAMRAGAGL
jgi:hypothetical protein